MNVVAFHHVNIVVDDVEAATRFYAQVLGLPVIDDRPPGMPPGGHFALGDAQLHLTLGDPLPASGQHFAIVVDDLTAVVDTLVAAGASVDVPDGTGATRTFVRDPAGNSIEIRLPDPPAA